MRSPIEDNGEQRMADSVSRAPAALPGGKVLARLHQLEQERGMELTDITETVVRDGAIGATYVEAAAQIAMSQPAAPTTSALRSEAPMAVPVPQGWRPLGPYYIPHGQTYGSGGNNRPAVAGRVSAIAVHPTNANHLLVGAAGGGVWQTTDGGANWFARTDQQPSLAIGALAFTPSNPSIAYAGTGEGNFFARLGAGLLRSTDGGTTWSVLVGAPFVGKGFYDLIVDPLNANHLLAATTGGLYESTNAGAAWTQRRAPKTWDLSMHPAVSGNPNSTKEVFGACADGLFLSINGGTAWAAVALPGGAAPYQRMAVAHAPSNGGIVWVFAVDAGGNARIWRRSAAGGAFAAVNTAGVAISTNQAWYDWFLGVAPNNPALVYLGEIHVLKGTLAGSTLNLVNISSKASGDSIHPDQHCITFGPTNPNDLIVGNDGGVYRSPDGGTSWKALNKGLSITEFEFLAQHPQFDAWLLGGTQDNGTQRYEGEEVWYHVQDGDGGDCGANGSSPYTCYQTFFGLGMRRSTTGGGWGSFANLPVPVAGSALFYPPMEVRGSVVVQAGQNVAISSDTGNTWVSVALPAGKVASALTIPSSTRIYAGTVQGEIYRIDKSGASWSAPVALALPRAGFVSDILVDPTNANVIWATYSTAGAGGHVFRTTNGGTSWTNVSAGLPPIPVNSVEIDPANPNTAWIAADVGVYRTTNAGAAWAPFNNLLPNALAKDLLFHPTRRLLRCATQSRGVWEIPVDAPTMPDVEVYLRDSLVDTVSITPSPSGVGDPFNFGANTHWWQCTDIKVDAPPFQPLVADFGTFNDDHGLASAGLVHENAQRTKTVRVLVQVHNRGPNPATNVAVKVFFADASAGLPNLPAGFWTGFPNNTVPANSPWKPIAAHQTLGAVRVGAPQIVTFNWTVPANAATHTCLLAIISAGNDAISTSQMNIGALVPSERRCGLKNLHIIDALAPSGAVKVNLWAGDKAAQYAVMIDGGGASTLAGVVLSKRLAEVALRAELAKVKLDDTAQTKLRELVKAHPGLELNMEQGFAVPRDGVFLKGVELQPDRPEPLALLIRDDAPAGMTSVFQVDERGTVVGGFTVEVRPKRG